MYNLHTKLGKPIPPPNTETAVVSKAATPKVNFIAGMYLLCYTSYFGIRLICDNLDLDFNVI